MKKNIFKFSLLLLVMCGFVLGSCKKEKTNPSTPEPVTATVTYTMPERHDIAKYFDLTISYTNSEGNEISEVVTSPTWEKVVAKAPVPGIYTLKLVYTRNKEVLAQESYTVGKGLTISYQVSNGKYQTTGFKSTLSVGKDKIEEYLKKITDETDFVEITE